MTTRDTRDQATSGSRWSGYPVKRSSRGTYRGRNSYLRAKQSPLPLRLCNVLGRGDGRSTMPWLTLVLGSGCLDEGSGPDGRTLAARVGDAVEHRLLADGSSPATRAQRFAESLIEGRLGSLDAPMPTLSEEDDLHPAAPPLVLAACLLTRMFYAIKAGNPGAVSRWDDDAVTLDLTDPGPGYDDIVAQLVLPAARELERAKALLDDDADGDGTPVDSAVSALLDQVLREVAGAGKARLTIQHLRLVTEIAWYYLVGDKTAYPGWTDMLVRLMLRGDEPTRAGSRRPRPRFLNLKLLGTYVCDLLETSSERSWERRLAAGAGRPPGIFDATASILWAQYEMLRKSDNRVELPPASGFVTSFDLELEMALWAQSEGRPFSIAVPVHLLRHKDDDEAEMCWLVADVRPDLADASGGLNSIRHPERWRLLHANVDEDGLRRSPLVVHLNGGPLLELPDLNNRDEPYVQALRRDFARVGLLNHADDGAALVHAVTVDEYLALRQSEAELFWASEDRAARAQRSSRALPHALVADSRPHSRFWMVLGVPVADPAIRHRVTSHLTIRRLRAGGPVAEFSAESGFTARADHAPAVDRARADVAGVAINKRIDDAEVGMLHWLGLDVVHSACADFTKDLAHYAHHVRSDGLSERAPDTGCGLHGGARA